MSRSYDMAVKVWSDGTAVGSYGSHPGIRGPGKLGSMEAYTEFATGVDG